MVKLITGNKGSGKTKKLIEQANIAIENSKGNVVLIEKGNHMKYDINHRARLIDINHYNVTGFNAFYGFIAGICAGNYDVTDILIDGTLKIGGRDFDELTSFLNQIQVLAKDDDVNVTLSVSADDQELPASIFEFAQKA